jgi:hypothetical protein
LVVAALLLVPLEFDIELSVVLEPDDGYALVLLLVLLEGVL